MTNCISTVVLTAVLKMRSEAVIFVLHLFFDASGGYRVKNE